MANLAHEGRHLEGTFDCGAGAVPAGGFAIRNRAALGIILSGTTTGARGASLHCMDLEKAGNARPDQVPGSMA